MNNFYPKLVGKQSGRLRGTDQMGEHTYRGAQYVRVEVFVGGRGATITRWSWGWVNRAALGNRSQCVLLASSPVEKVNEYLMKKGVFQ